MIMSAWDPTSAETSKSYSRFIAFLELGPDRTLPKLNQSLGRKPSYLTQLKRWSSAHEWQRRAKAYDAAELAERADDRKLITERVRQILFDRGIDAANTVINTMLGECPIPACKCKAADPADCTCDPVTTPVLDRHGREIGSKPLIAPSSRFEAARAVLDRIGITVPKRLEHTGADGGNIELELRQQAGQFTDEQLAAMSAAFLPEAEEDPEA